MNWLRRLRAFGSPWSGDRAAAQGADGLEASVNWMHHVLARDYPGREVGACIVVAEVGAGPEAVTVYTTHSVDANPSEVRGLVTDALRFLDERAEKMEDAIQNSGVEAERLSHAYSLLKIRQSCLDGVAVATDETVREAYREAATWAEEELKETMPEEWLKLREDQ